MKARILFFFSSLPAGGAERQSIDLATELGRRGYDCRFLCYHPRYSPIVVTDAVLSRTTFVDGGRVSSPSGTMKAWKAIAHAAPDLLIAVGTAPLRLSTWGRMFRQCNTRIICAYHETIPMNQGIDRGRLFRWSMPMADCLIYVSERQRQYWQERGLRCSRVEVIRNGIDTSHFTAEAGDRSTARRALGLGGDDYVVGLLAAFRPEKNHLQLIDAIAALRARGIRAKALFVGDGQTRAATESYARTKGITEHALFVGEQRDVRSMIAAMDVGVLCSISETMPLSALECMAMGVPMVMSDVGGSGEIVDDGINGRLFAVGDTPALIEHLSALTNEPLRQSLAASAVATVCRSFTAEQMVDRYEQVFQSVVDQ